MADLVEQLAICIERGKVNAASPYPPDLKGQDGAEELTKRALEAGVPPDTILAKGIIAAMSRVAQDFSDNKVFVPDLLMAQKAMSVCMVHLKPYFDSGQAHHKGTFVIGTVQGDLHDIGKNLVAKVVEGGGWLVVDLGQDVAPEKFLAAVQANRGAAVGLSALLTTTMINMEKTVKLVKQMVPGTRVIVGGAPLTADFAKKIGADAYSPDPLGALNFLAEVAKPAAPAKPKAAPKKPAVAKPKPVVKKKPAPAKKAPAAKKKAPAAKKKAPVAKKKAVAKKKLVAKKKAAPAKKKPVAKKKAAPAKKKPAVAKKKAPAAKKTARRK